MLMYKKSAGSSPTLFCTLHYSMVVCEQTEQLYQIVHVVPDLYPSQTAFSSNWRIDTGMPLVFDMRIAAVLESISLLFHAVNVHLSSYTAQLMPEKSMRYSSGMVIFFHPLLAEELRPACYIQPPAPVQIRRV